MIKATETQERQHLPIGSVVRVHGNDNNMMITSLFPVTEKGGEQGYFDFGAVLLPLGAVTRDLMFFNKEDIDQIIYLGYVDVHFQELIANYDELVDKIEYPKFTVQEFKEMEDQNPFKKN